MTKRRTVVGTALLQLLTPLFLLGLNSRADAETPPVIHQLRIYEIFEHNKAAFNSRFQKHATRIMRRYGFKILATWEARRNGRTEFVYMLEWPNEAVMKERWLKFLADEEWIEIKRKTAAQHGRLVGEIEDRTLRPVAPAEGTFLK